MSYGLPVVSTMFGIEGIAKEFLEGVRVVDDRDDAGFAASIVELYDSPQLRAEQGKAAFASALRWTREQKRKLALLMDEAAVKNAASRDLAAVN